MSNQYVVNFGLTYTIEADNEEQAAELAEQALIDDWGKALSEDVWTSQPEKVTA